MIENPPAATTAYSRASTVFVIGNSAAARSCAVDVAASADMRVIGQGGLGDAHETRTPAAIIFIEVDACEPCDADALQNLLVRVNADAAVGRCAAIVSTPAALIDLVAAHAPAVGHQLADATDADRIAALLLAAAPPASVVRESAAGNAELVRLARLTEEVARVAAALAHVSPVTAPLLAEPNPEGPPVGADEIRKIVRARRLRAQFFDGELFADPAWDMLLDLAAAQATRERVAVSSLCIAAAVPPTTALRWIRTLTEAGLFVRTADPADGRRVFIELTDTAATSMQAYLAALRRIAD